MKNNSAVSELLSAWMARQDSLDNEQRQLRSAVIAYADGRGGDPSQLLEVVKALRADCDSIFSSLVWLIGSGKPTAT